jgi:hypothetical protein
MYFHFFIIKFHYLIFNYQNQTMIRFLIINHFIKFIILILQNLIFILKNYFIMNYLLTNLFNSFYSINLC